MNKDLVSIITPSYNCERFISETIESVLQQKYKNWELIIVDDNSTDKSLDIINSYAKNDVRIKVLPQKINQGAGVSRNIGIKASKGEFIAFLDSDDLWLPEKLEIQIAFMKKNNYAFTHTSYYFINENGKKLPKVYNTKAKLSYKDMLYSNRIGCLSVVLNQEKTGKLYMPKMRKRQDYAHWLTILKKEDFAFGIEKPLAKYRLRNSSVSSNKVEMLKWNFKLFYKNQELSLLKSIYYVFCNVFVKITE